MICLSFPAKLAEFIHRHQLLAPGDRAAVAVSGGADSVALLRALVELRHRLGIVVMVAHFNHKIRPESDAEAAWVGRLAGSFDLEFYCGEADTSAVAKARGISLETAARDLRYEWFSSRFIAPGTTARVVTAHTLDDQAETVLMKLLRGAGTKGLSGIWPRLTLPSGLVVIRPMLELRHREAQDYLQQIGQEWHEDASNLDPRHTRNKVRHQLLPLLEKEYNPCITGVLADLAAVMRTDEEYWEEQIRRFSPCDASQKTHSVQLPMLQQLPTALQRRVLREAFRLASGLSLDYEHTERLADLLHTRSSLETLQLPQRWMAILDRKNRRLRFEVRVAE